MNILLFDIFDLKNKMVDITRLAKINNVNIIYIKYNKKILDKLLYFCYNNKVKLSILKIGNLICYIFHFIYLLIEKQLQKHIKKYTDKYLEDKNKKTIAIFGNYILSDNKYLNYITTFLKRQDIQVLKQLNTIKTNDIKNIEKYIAEKKLDIKKLKILWIIKNLSSIDIEKLIEYIKKYKFVDILNVGHNFASVAQKIKAINTEYGSSIEIINKKNIFEFNIYISFDVDKNYLKNNYIINSKSMYIDMNDSTTDCFNTNYLMYKKYQGPDYMINDLLNITRFNLLDIGYIYTKIYTT